MKKRIGILLLVVMLFIQFGSYAFAAGDVASGFFNIGSKENVAITPYKGNSAVESVSIDVDGDRVEDVWFVDSNRLKVSYSVADNDGYYGVLLVEGSALPTVDNAIFYVDQVAPKSKVVEFDVYPLLPEAEGEGKEITALTLYISCSKQGAELVSIPLSYVIGADAAEAPSYTPGDVNEDGSVNSFDRTALSRYVAQWTGYGPEAEGRNKVNLSAADVYTGGVAGVNSFDRTVISRHVAQWTGYETLPMTSIPK